MTSRNVAVLAIAVAAALLAGCGTIFDKIGKKYTAFSVRRDVAAFDPASQGWAVLPGMPADDLAQTGVVAASGRIYILASGSDAAFRFDANAASGVGAWEVLPPLPEPRVDAAAVAASPTAVCVASGVGPSGPLPFVEVLDDTAPAPAWGRIATPFRRFQAAVVAAGGRLYVIGGFDENNVAHTDVWELANVTSSALATDWKKKGDLSQPRCFAGAFVLGTQVHIVSGHAGDGAPLATEDVYDLATGAVPTASSPTAIPTARLSPQCVVIGDRALVYDARTPILPLTGALDSWTAADGWTSRKRNPSPLNNPSVAVTGGELLVAGGADSISRSQVQIYDPIADTWTPLNGMPFTRTGGYLASSGGRTFYVGGFEAHEERVTFKPADFLGL